MRWLTICALGALLAACDGDAPVFRGAAEQAEPEMAPAAPPPVAGDGLTGSAAMNQAASRYVGTAAGADAGMHDPAGQALAGAVPQPGAMLIRTGYAVVRIDSLETAVARVRALAARFGGEVANVSVQSGEHEVRSATLEIRIPAARFDEAVAGLSPLGEVRTVNVQAQDVGEEYVDLTARLENARRLESRLIELLGSRTGKLSDVLAVERELARVREELERYEGRLRYLQTRVATSTLTVTVEERGPLVGQPGEGVLARALHQAWRNFVNLVAFVIAASGVLVPLAIVTWAGVSLVRRWRRPITSAEVQA